MYGQASTKMEIARRTGIIVCTIEKANILCEQGRGRRGWHAGK